MLDNLSRLAVLHDRTMAAEIVAADVEYNFLPSGELTSLMRSVHKALFSVTAGPLTSPELEVTEPALPITKSVQDDFIVCPEDAKRLRSFKRHLATTYGWTSGQYGAKRGLAQVYSIMAPACARRLPSLAGQMDFGRRTGATGRGTENTLIMPTEPDIVPRGFVKRRKRADA